MSRRKQSNVVLVRVDRAAERRTRHPRHIHPPLELKTIQAALHAAPGLDVALVDHWRHPGPTGGLVSDILALKPRIVVIKALSWCLEESIAIAHELRTRGVITIAVGQQVTHAALQPLPDWDEAYDLAIRGEPEEAAPKLIRDLLAGADLGILRQKNRMRMAQVEQVSEPDTLPRLQFDSEELDDYPFPFPLPGRPVHRWGYVQSSWGCPSRCLHCTEMVRKSVGYRFRTRSPERIADDVVALVDAGADGICFEDDSLLADRKHFLELCDALTRRDTGARWIASVRPDQIDEEVTAAAASAGAALFKVGVESGSPRQIEQIGKSHDGHDWLARSQRAFTLLEKYRIGSVALFLVGLPGETAAERDASIALARKLRPTYVQVQMFTAYPDVSLESPPTPTPPGTGLYHYAVGADATPAAFQARFYRAIYLHPGYMTRHLQHCWRTYLDPAYMRLAAGHAIKALRFIARPHGEPPLGSDH